MTILQRREHFVAQEFVEALGHGGEGFEVRVVEGPHRRMVEHVQVRLAEHQVDGVRRWCHRAGLAGKITL